MLDVLFDLQPNTFLYMVNFAKLVLHIPILASLHAHIYGLSSYDLFVQLMICIRFVNTSYVMSNFH